MTPTPALDLDDLTVLCAVTGEPAALAWLYSRHHPLVLRVAARALARLGLHDEPPELAAEVWLRLLDRDRRALGAFDPARGPFRAFLSMVAWQHALSIALRWRRRHQRESTDRPECPFEPLAPCVTTVLHHRCLLGRVLAEAWPRLTPTDLVLLQQGLLWGTSADELGRRLGLTSNDVYKHNQRLRARLRAAARRLEARRGGMRPTACELSSTPRGPGMRSRPTWSGPTGGDLGGASTAPAR